MVVLIINGLRNRFRDLVQVRDYIEYTFGVWNVTSLNPES